MKYYIQRGINEYGPYTLAELQRYVAQGNIALTDLARSEAMTEWIPVSQIIGNIPVAPPPAPVAPAAAVMPATPSAGTVYSGAPAAAAAAPVMVGAAPVMAVGGPVPPDLHWALVLLIAFFCGIFSWVWLFIEAAFVKKIKPDSNCLMLLITAIGIEFGAVIFFYVALFAQFSVNPNSQEPPWAALVILVVGSVAGIVIHIMGIFKMRSGIQEYYNTVEPINLRLSGVMTFFFSLFYFQYHFTRIANWKKTGYLVPQQ